MSHGKIEQVGTPVEIYDAPANPFVCQFLGSANLILAENRGRRLVHPAIALDGLHPPPVTKGKQVRIYVRPHDIEISPDEHGQATVHFVSTVGSVARIDVNAKGIKDPVEVEIPTHRRAALDLQPGSKVRLAVLKGHIY